MKHWDSCKAKRKGTDNGTCSEPCYRGMNKLMLKNRCDKFQAHSSKSENAFTEEVITNLSLDRLTRLCLESKQQSAFFMDNSKLKGMKSMRQAFPFEKS